MSQAMLKKLQGATICLVAVAVFCSGALSVGAATSTWKYKNFNAYAQAVPLANRPVLRSGASGEAVHAVQVRLYTLKLLPQKGIDGQFGPVTSDAVIAFQKWKGLDRDGVVGPKTWKALQNSTAAAKAPLGGGKYAYVDRQKQLLYLVNNGKVARLSHISSGDSNHTTPSGDFSVYRKETMSWSVPFEQWLPLASYFNGGIAFHEYASVPVYPASHGCVRIPTSNAKYVYDFLSLSTPVYVR